MSELLHRNLFIEGREGRLESILWGVENSNTVPPQLAALVCHPHPLFGGTMHNKVVYQTAKTLHRFGIPVLRFNFRGAGLSAGTHDKGHGEQGDVSAALNFLAEKYSSAQVLLAGFSFGSWVGLRVGCLDARVIELIGLGLPVGGIGVWGFAYLETCAKPKLLVTGEFDEHAPPAILQAMIEKLPDDVRDTTQVSIVPGADHFFAGHLSQLDWIISEWVRGRHPELHENAAG